MRYQRLSGIHACLLIILLSVMVGCSEEKRETEAHEQAEAFFNALYNERDMEKVAELASEDYRRVLMHYGASSSIGRYLYNMNFDEVEIIADRRGISLYQDRADTARVQVSFTGMHAGRKRESLREVVMIRENGNWRIDRVLDGPMN
ncbi:hypothetical protein CWE09_03350 [Aliidiomarina minuta]|uniref:DUF4878 domain-containing protein n=1 Tax=Aliidiomarina minuta TaxID=880057 RepID=A0A432W6T0_9GAMM|nr:hypothetical protein [Aliidiomarina minuta]RUO25780.1 hypothetical protein CWE09_03350 [Aliidiomarina minuta]